MSCIKDSSYRDCDPETFSILDSVGWSIVTWHRLRPRWPIMWSSCLAAGREGWDGAGRREIWSRSPKCSVQFHRDRPFGGTVMKLTTFLGVHKSSWGVAGLVVRQPGDLHGDGSTRYRLYIRLSVRPSVSPSVRPSFRPSFHPSVRSSVHPSVRPSDRPSVRPSVCSSVRSSILQSLRLSVRLPSVHLSVQPPVRPSVRSSICPPIYPSVRPYVRSAVHSSVRLSLRPSVRLSVRPSVRSSIWYVCQLDRQSICLFVRPHVQTSCIIGTSWRQKVHPLAEGRTNVQQSVRPSILPSGSSVHPSVTRRQVRPLVSQLRACRLPPFTKHSSGRRSL